MAGEERLDMKKSDGEAMMIAGEPRESRGGDDGNGGGGRMREMGEIAIVGLMLACAGDVIASHYHGKQHINNTGE